LTIWRYWVRPESLRRKNMAVLDNPPTPIDRLRIEKQRQNRQFVALH
jgi:hypothetical protein